MNGVKILTPNSFCKLIKEAYLRGENNGHETGYLSGYEAGYSDGQQGINRSPGVPKMDRIEWDTAQCPICLESYDYPKGGYKPKTCGKFDCIHKYMHPQLYRLSTDTMLRIKNAQSRP